MIMKTFAELGLPAPVVAALAARGIETPTPIQSQVFAPAAAGKDVLAQSRTGSGKTLAFGLPLFGRLDAKEPVPQMLVLTPTRELAVQVAKELESPARLLGLSVVSVIGGGSYRDQIRGFKRSQIVVGTPGRLIDHIEKGTLQLGAARAIVLDEGDEMLDMGFLEEITKILEAFPAGSQRLLFSATVPPAMKRVIANYLRDPVHIRTESAQTAHADITHVFYEVRATDRYAALANLLLHEPIERALVFTQTKAESSDLAARLSQDGLAAMFLNGDLSQDQRTQVMEAFRAGRANLLIATDVAARGIDVQGISHVIQYTLPGSAETYTHRSGRTGRAGVPGVAVAIVSRHEYAKAQRIAYHGHFEPLWRKVPNQKEIEKVRAKRLREQIMGADAPSPRAVRIASELLGEGADAADIVARLVERLHAAGHPGYNLEPLVEYNKRDQKPAGKFGKPPFEKRGRFERSERPERGERFERGERPAFPPRPERKEFEDRAAGEVAPAAGWVKESPVRKRFEQGPPGERTQFRKRESESGMVRYKVPLGARHRLTPGSLIQSLCRSTGLKGADFGRIDVQTNYSFFDVKEGTDGKLRKQGEFTYDGKPVPVAPVK
jgi:ATP-dependent RNA helicase DeaD